MSTTALVGAVFVAVIFAALALVTFGFYAMRGFLLVVGSANAPYRGADTSGLCKSLAVGCSCFCIFSVAGGLLTWLVLCDGSHLCATLP